MIDCYDFNSQQQMGTSKWRFNFIIIMLILIQFQLFNLKMCLIRLQTELTNRQTNNQIINPFKLPR